MPVVDIYGSNKRFQRQFDLLEESDLPEETKTLLKEFIEDALHGWGTKKISKVRTAKLLSHLRHIAEILHKKNYTFEYLTEKELKYLLKEIDRYFYEKKRKRGLDSGLSCIKSK